MIMGALSFSDAGNENTYSSSHVEIKARVFFSDGTFLLEIGTCDSV